MRIPKNRLPTHPGEMLVEEFLAPTSMTQLDLAKRLRVPFQRVNQICNGRRAVTVDTAMRLSRLLGTSVEFWLNLQQRWDLAVAAQSREAGAIRAIRPLIRKAS